MKIMELGKLSFFRTINNRGKIYGYSVRVIGIIAAHFDFHTIWEIFTSCNFVSLEAEFFS